MRELEKKSGERGTTCKTFEKKSGERGKTFGRGGRLRAEGSRSIVLGFFFIVGLDVG